jgi:adenylate cyclase
VGVDGRALARSVQRRLENAMGAANFAGAMLVFVFLTFVAPTPTPDRWDITRTNLIAFVALMPLAMGTGRYLTIRLFRVHRRWLQEGREPDERERALVLDHPLRMFQLVAVMWALVGAVFVPLNATYSLALAVEVAISIAAGAEATCAIAYLLTERIMRPVTERALAGRTRARPRSRVPGVEARMAWAWALPTGLALMGVVMVSVAALVDSDVSTGRLAGTTLFLALTAIGVGWMAIVMAARSVADPVDSVRSALERVEEGELDVEVPVYDSSEVGLLQAGFNRMVLGLREREQLRDLLGRQVGEDVAREALERGVRLGGELREVAVFFVDLLRSTSLAATRDPREVVDTLNAFFATVVDMAKAHGGWVNKFEGDAALCVFGAPVARPNPAADALCAARELSARLARDLPEAPAAIGVSAGKVVAGNVGTSERFEYTVIGDPVNEAARLTELAKSAPHRLLASAEVLGRAGSPEAEHWRVGREVELRGRGEPTRVAAPVAA